MSKQSPTLLLRYLRCLAQAGETGKLADRELVQRFADRRDEAAFTALIRRHGAMVLGVCRRVLGHEQEAEDVFQAAFLVLSRKAGGLRSKDAVGPWLFGVARRLALKARRQGYDRRAREARAGARLAGSLLEELTIREAQSVLDEELTRLPDRQRGPLVLCYLQGLTRDEAAQRLGCPLRTLTRRLAEARAALQRRLTRRGVAVNAALGTLLLTGTSAYAVRADLVTKTVKAGLVFAGGATVRGIVALRAAALAEGMLNAALAGKIKIAAFCLAMTLACVSLGLSSSFDSRETVAEGIEQVVAPKDPSREPPAPAPISARDTGKPGKKIEEPIGIAPGAPMAAEVKPKRPTGKWEALARLAGHQGGARALAFSADNTRLVSGGDDGYLRVWDVATRSELRALGGSKRRPVRALALGADGTVAVGNDGGSLFVYDLHGPQEPKLAYGSRQCQISALTFGHDGRSLAWARSDGAVECQNECDGVAAPPASQAGQITCVALSPDGQRVVWGMKDGSVKLWDVVTGKELGHFPRHQHQVWCVTFSSDGRTAASVDHFGNVSLWDAFAGKERTLLWNPCRGGHVHVLALAFSPDGDLMATGGGGDHTIRIWDTQSGKELAHLLDHRGPICGLAFSPDGRLLASASGDGTVRLWTPVRGERREARGE
jgi:RNA polymerase sigma factor (sigma-70 family)